MDKKLGDEIKKKLTTMLMRTNVQSKLPKHYMQTSAERKDDKNVSVYVRGMCVT